MIIRQRAASVQGRPVFVNGLWVEGPVNEGGKLLPGLNA